MKKPKMAASERYPKDDFFDLLERQFRAVTFDEVKIRTRHSDILPANVDLNTQFSRRVPLRVPFVSAAMDTVTEYPMAIAMAMLGGIGVIHRAMSIEAQAKQVARVKHRIHGRVNKPICVQENDTVETVRRMRQEEDYPFESFLVLNTDNLLTGVITGRDFQRSNAETLIRDAMTPTRELVTAAPDTTLEEAYCLFRGRARRVNLLPLVNVDGTVAGLYVYSDVERIMTGAVDAYNTDADGKLRVAAAVGVGDEALERAAALAERDVDALVIDTAHGDTSSVKETLRDLKNAHPDIDIVAGNVSEPESARRLAEWGADGIKVGQGPGSICTTRSETGVGCPQLSAIANCEKAVRAYGIPVCGDGGISKAGDVALALAAGASSVMMGRMLAGTTEAPGKLLLVRGRTYKLYRGMGSLAAMRANVASLERYKQGKSGGEFVSEGVESLEPFKGPVATIIRKLSGELRNALGYNGAQTILAFQKTARFWLHSAAGERESNPHDINEIPEWLPDR